MRPLHGASEQTEGVQHAIACSVGMIARIQAAPTYPSSPQAPHWHAGDQRPSQVARPLAWMGQGGEHVGSRAVCNWSHKLVVRSALRPSLVGGQREIYIPRPSAKASKGHTPVQVALPIRDEERDGEVGLTLQRPHARLHACVCACVFVC